MTLQWVWITMRQPEVGWEPCWMGCLWTSNYVTRERMISTVTACVCSNKYVQNVILNQTAYPVIIPMQFGSNQVTKMLVFIINLVSCGREYHKSFIETLVTSWCLQLLTFRCGRLGVACFSFFPVMSPNYLTTQLLAPKTRFIGTLHSTRNIWFQRGRYYEKWKLERSNAQDGITLPLKGVARKTKATLLNVREEIADYFLCEGKLSWQNDYA